LPLIIRAQDASLTNGKKNGKQAKKEVAKVCLPGWFVVQYWKEKYWNRDPSDNQ